MYCNNMRSEVWCIILAIIFVSETKAAADPTRHSSESRHHEPKSSKHGSRSQDQNQESFETNNDNYQTTTQNDDRQHKNRSFEENHSQNENDQRTARNQEKHQNRMSRNQSSLSYTPKPLIESGSSKDSRLSSEAGARQDHDDGHRHADVHGYRESHGEHHEFEELDLGGLSREEKEEVRDEDIEQITADMYYVLGAKSLREASDAMYELTGFRKEAEAIQYVMDNTGIKTKDQAYIFLRKVRGSRSCRFVIEFMNTLQGTSNIKVIVDLLREFTNQQDVFKAFKILRVLTGHADFDGIYESLQKMSGEKYLHEVCDYFKHKTTNHVDGVAGVRKEVYDITGGIGPAEFPRIMKVLLPEVDMNGAFNLLILATRTGDLGEAIREFVKIMRTKTIAEAVLLLKKVTKQTQFKYALEELTQATNRGSIKVIIYSLYKIAGKEDMKEVQRVFHDVFESDNIVTVIQKVNKVTKLQEPLHFLMSLLDVTQSDNLSEAGAVIKGLTVKKLPVLDILEQIRVMSGHEDIVNFFRKLIVFTGTKSVQQAWEVLKSVTFIPDLFLFFETVSKYTDVDAIAFMETLLRITNSTNIGVAAAMLCKISNKKYFFEVIQSIFEITGIDVVKLFEIIITISKRFFFEEVVIIIEEYTDTTNFIDALADLKKATGQQDIISAIEYIKANKPRIERLVSITTTTTEETTTNTTTEESTTETEKPTTTEEPIITTVKPITTTVILTSNVEPTTKSTTFKMSITTEEPIITIKPTTTLKPNTTITEKPTITKTTDESTTTTTDTTTTTIESIYDTSEITPIKKTTTDDIEDVTLKQIADEIDQNKYLETTNNAKETIIIVKQNKDGTFSLLTQPAKDDRSESSENSTDQTSGRKTVKDHGITKEITVETSGQTTTELVTVEDLHTQDSSVRVQETTEVVETTESSTDTMTVKSVENEIDETQSTEVQSKTEDTTTVVKFTTLQTTESSTDNSHKTDLTTQTTSGQLFRVDSNDSITQSESYQNEETETSTKENDYTTNRIDDYDFESNTINIDGSTTTEVQMNYQTIDSQTKSGQETTIVHNTTEPSAREEFEYEEYDEDSSLIDLTEPNTQTTTEGAYYADEVTESKNIRTNQVNDYEDQTDSTIRAYTDIAAATTVVEIVAENNKTTAVQDTTSETGELIIEQETTTQCEEKPKYVKLDENTVDDLDFNNKEYDFNTTEKPDTTQSTESVTTEDTTTGTMQITMATETTGSGKLTTSQSSQTTKAAITTELITTKSITTSTEPVITSTLPITSTTEQIPVTKKTVPTSAESKTTLTELLTTTTESEITDSTDYESSEADISGYSDEIQNADSSTKGTYLDYISTEDRDIYDSATEDTYPNNETNKSNTEASVQSNKYPTTKHSDAASDFITSNQTTTESGYEDTYSDYETEPKITEITHPDEYTSINYDDYTGLGDKIGNKSGNDKDITSKTDEGGKHDTIIQPYPSVFYNGTTNSESIEPVIETTTKLEFKRPVTETTTKVESADSDVSHEIIDSRQDGDTFYGSQTSREYNEITESALRRTESETTSAKIITKLESTDDYVNVSDDIYDRRQEEDITSGKETSQEYDEIIESEPQTTEITSSIEQPFEKSITTLAPELSQPRPGGEKQVEKSITTLAPELSQPKPGGEHPTTELLTTTPKSGGKFSLNKETTTEPKSMESVTETTTETESTDDYANVSDDFVDSKQGDTSYGSENSQEYDEITKSEPQSTKSETTSATEQPVDKSTTTLSPELSQANPPGQPRPNGEPSTKLLTTTPKSGGKLALNQGTRDIMHALEASMNLKVLILPNGPAGRNCFCTCEANGSPSLIPVDALPAELTQV